MYLRLFASPHRRRRSLAAALIALGATATAAVAAPAARADGIELKTAFAAPIAATNALCTAEPRAYVYGTRNYDSSKALTFASSGIPGYGFYVPPNTPSSLDLTPVGDAGARADLCAGVTFPPDVEPTMMRDFDNLGAPRLQDTPAWPDLAQTHVVPDSGQPAPVGDDARTVAIDLPAAYQAQLSAITPCSTADFGEGGFTDAACPAGSQVGEAFVRLSGYTTAGFHTPVAVKLYALDHGPNELARLGLSMKPLTGLAQVKLTARVLFAADGSGRLQLLVGDVPRATYDASAIAKVGTHWDTDDITDPADPRIGQPVPGATVRQLYLESFSLRLWGSVAGHATLAADVGTLGSTCATPFGGAASATTYGGVGSVVNAPTFSLGGCGALALPGGATVTTTEHAAATPTGATVDIDLPQPTTTLAAALLHSARIGLPDGLDVGLQFAAGSGASVCRTAQFGADSVRAAATCPAGSKIGTAQLQTALGDLPFTGSVYLGTPATPSASEAALPGDQTVASVFLDTTTAGGTTADAPRIKATGRLVHGADGTTNLVFDALPAVRFTHATLTFRGGSSALFTTPDRCGAHGATAYLQAGGSGPTTTAATSLTIDSRCGLPAAASLGLTSTTATSGGGDATGVSLLRPASSAPLSGFSIALPTGVLVAESTVPACDAEAAATAGCADASRLGTVRLAAGPAGIGLNGSIYRATSPGDAAAAGVIVVDAVPAGLDLGRIVVPVRFELRPADGAETMTAELPSHAGGARLDLRSLAIEFDAPGAMTTPTACGPVAASARVATAAGDLITNAPSATYASCAGRGFGPAFSAQAGSDAAGRARVATLITATGGGASLRSATISLPGGFAVDGAAARACSPDDFRAGACAAAARVGSAAAMLSVAPDVIAGDIVLVSSPGQALPAFGITFTGRLGYRASGQLVPAAAGRVALRLADLPDLPVNRLSLDFDGGAGSLFTQNPAACDAGAGWSATLAAQNGQSVDRAAAVTCGAPVAPPKLLPKPLPPPVKVTKTKLEFSMSGKTGLKLKLNGFSGRRLQSAKLTLPKTLRFSTKAVKKKGNISVVVLGAKVKTGFTGGSLKMSMPVGTATEAVIRVRPQAYFKDGPAASGKVTTLQKFRVRLAFADGTSEARTATARLP